MSTDAENRNQAARARALAWIQQGPKRLLIGGQWVEAASGKTFEVLNPATEQQLCQVAEADRADVDAAGRFVEDQKPRLGFQPFGQHHFLLVTA